MEGLFMKKSLRDMLKSLKENNGLVGMKTGTEIEGMNFAEIKELKELSSGIVPLTVKIGGPGAVNDILEMLNIGVDSILAPMVESEYAVENFVQTVIGLCEFYKKEIPRLCINIETYTAHFNLEEIINNKYFKEFIEGVTIGRGDLAASYKRDRSFINNVVWLLSLRLGRDCGKTVSVGGGFSAKKDNFSFDFPSDTINTRHMIIMDKEYIREMLLFEIEIYKYLNILYPERSHFYKSRISEIKKRL